MPSVDKRKVDKWISIENERRQREFGKIDQSGEWPATDSALVGSLGDTPEKIGIRSDTYHLFHSRTEEPESREAGTCLSDYAIIFIHRNGSIHQLPDRIWAKAT